MAKAVHFLLTVKKNSILKLPKSILNTTCWVKQLVAEGHHPSNWITVFSLSLVNSLCWVFLMISSAQCHHTPCEQFPVGMQPHPPNPSTPCCDSLVAKAWVIETFAQCWTNDPSCSGLQGSEYGRAGRTRGTALFGARGEREGTRGVGGQEPAKRATLFHCFLLKYFFQPSEKYACIHTVFEWLSENIKKAWLHEIALGYGG